MTRNDTDVLIAGGGFAGLTLGIALRQALGPTFTVVVADPALGASHASDERASAIVAAARRLFETVGVWHSVADDAQPILDMVVTDSRLDDAVRPVFLTFASEVEPGEPFAHMIENRKLVDALEAKARGLGVELRAAAVKEFSPPLSGERHNICPRLSDGGEISTRLLVAADGARSTIRTAAGIATHGWNYGQSAIVINVEHERDHEGRAEEHFLRRARSQSCRSRAAALRLSGPSKRAKPNASWRCRTTPSTQSLNSASSCISATIKVIGARRVHPLGFFVARSFIADRIALVGDAAHIIHPIAGQGLNMGLKDVAALAEVVVDAARLGLDPGSASVLEQYQRWRRFDTMTMGLATDGLNRLFSNRSDLLRVARDVGLGMVERLPGLKRLFIREAAGLAGEVPKLLRGKSL